MGSAVRVESSPGHSLYGRRALCRRSISSGTGIGVPRPPPWRRTFGSVIAPGTALRDATGAVAVYRAVATNDLTYDYAFKGPHRRSRANICGSSQHHSLR